MSLSSLRPGVDTAELLLQNTPGPVPVMLCSVSSIYIMLTTCGSSLHPAAVSSKDVGMCGMLWRKEGLHINSSLVCYSVR